MIKKIIQILLIGFLILIIGIFYLSIFGVKTDKFNDQITKNFLKINKEINLSLKNVNYLLNPYNFTIKIKTKNPQLVFEGKIFGIKSIQTNIALKSIFNNQLSIDDLKIETKEIKLNDIIKLVRVFKDSQQLLILDAIIKDGFIIADVKFNFNENGEIKKDYEIKGSVKKVKLNFLNQIKLKNLNFNFNINKNIYLLKQIDMQLNTIEITSPLISVEKKKNLFFVDGQFLNKEKNFNIKELKSIFVNTFISHDIQKIEFSSKNNFSFNINKKLKFNDLQVESIIDLDQLVVSKKELKLKPYLPSFVNEIKLERHKISINYNKKRLDIKGNGNILLEENSDKLSYQIIKNKNDFLFNLKLNLKNNSLLVDFLDYEKKENLNSIVSIKGNFKNDSQLSFDLINLKAKNNEILIEGLELNERFQIKDIKNFNINYENNKKILNNISLAKNNSNFIIEGESFDASRIINNIMDNDNENSFIFDNLNSKININIKKTYIDKVNYINNLYGDIRYNNNKIENLNLESNFPNNKKINLSIKTKDNSEIITKLFSAYPKPLIKRYDFIKGFEEGYLDFYSSKKEGVSNSVLIIDNFKVKEVPIFAFFLSLA